jgi:hypothetical protein
MKNEWFTGSEAVATIALQRTPSRYEFCYPLVLSLSTSLRALRYGASAVALAKAEGRAHVLVVRQAHHERRNDKAERDG